MFPKIIHVQREGERKDGNYGDDELQSSLDGDMWFTASEFSFASSSPCSF